MEADGKVGSVVWCFWLEAYYIETWEHLYTSPLISHSLHCAYTAGASGTRESYFELWTLLSYEDS